ncbi:hypothetical protein BGX28_001089, partial [Mortierella sp. GBA30]
MSRSISLTRLLTISVFLLQVATCLAISSGYYRIRNEEGYLVVGPRAPVFPPPPVPARLADGGPIAEQTHWYVEKAENGYSIRKGPDFPYVYYLVARDYEVWAEPKVQGFKPTQWSVTPAGQGKYNIGLPYEDSLVTGDVYYKPQVVLVPAQGTPSQRWFLEPVAEEYRG